MDKKKLVELKEILGDYSWYYIDKLEPFINQLINSVVKECAKIALNKKKQIGVIEFEGDIYYNKACRAIAKVIRDKS